MIDARDRIGVDPHAVLLGEVVTWDMPTRETPYSAVVAALDAAGLPKSAAKDLRPRTAFTRAVKDLREGRTIDRVKADKKTSIVTFQFTRKALDSAGLTLEFDFEALCHLDTDTGRIDCPDSPAIEAHARTMFAHALAHRNTSDITRLVQGLFQTHADLYPINPKKGVAYFVPEAHREFSAKVEKLLRDLGGSLLRFPVPKGTPEGNRAVKESVESGLTALVQDLQTAVDQWDEHTRENTFEKAVSRWQVIRHKAEAYSTYLGDRQARLLAALDAQKKRLAQKVAQLQSAKQADTHGDTQRTMFPGATAPIRDEEPASA